MPARSILCSSDGVYGETRSMALLGLDRGLGHGSPISHYINAPQLPSRSAGRTRIVTSFRSLSNLGWRALRLWRVGCSSFGPRLVSRPSMRWLSSRWKQSSNFRFMAPSRVLLRQSVRVGYLLVALVYCTSSLLSDYEYGEGIRTGDATAFYKASNLFPLLRERRSAPGYVTSIRGDHKHIALIEDALRFDPNAADLWLSLMLMRLQEGNQPEAHKAAVALTRLVSPP